MSSPFRKIVIFGGPTLVGILNLSHPLIRPPIYRAVIHHLPWWTTLHVLNLFLFPILGSAVYFLVKDVRNFAALLSRIAIILFIPIYAAFDALAGVGTGILVQQGSSFSAANLSGIESLIDAYWTSPIIASIAAIGSIAWVIAMLAASVAFADAHRRRIAAVVALIVFLLGGWAQVHLFLPAVGGPIPLLWWIVTILNALLVLVFVKPRIPATLLTLAALLFGASHVTPTGPLGMLCLLAAAIYIQVKHDSSLDADYSSSF